MGAQLGFPKSLEWPTICGHSLAYLLQAQPEECGLCFLQNGYADEVPKTLHRLRTLADNGKPDQTGSFQAHVRVVEGLIWPEEAETMHQFRQRRAYLKLENSGFPFAASLWYIAGKQPPLAKPLIKAVVYRRTHDQIRGELSISMLNLVERMRKGIDMTYNYLLRSHA